MKRRSLRKSAGSCPAPTRRRSRTASAPCSVLGKKRDFGEIIKVVGVLPKELRERC